MMTTPKQRRTENPPPMRSHSDREPFTNLNWRGIFERSLESCCDEAWSEDTSRASWRQYVKPERGEA